ncbi:Xaa-Pro dipeptidyl-peptidase [Streptococcus cameli]
MRFNQFSYIQTDTSTQLAELQKLGFALSLDKSDKENLEIFLRRYFFLTEDIDFALSNWIADETTDLQTFFTSDAPLSADIFYTAALQLLGFVPFVDYQDLKSFLADTQFPITFENAIDNLYQLLNTRTKSGNLLVEELISTGLLPEINDYVFFNGKTLATFSHHDVIREVVYVQTPVDTTKSGKTDLVKVSILRPNTMHTVPAIITNSPYHQGTNDKASDAALHKMEGTLQQKETGRVVLNTPYLPTDQATTSDAPISEATETLGAIDSYSLNDYFLARGFASIHVSGVGTLGSTGYMTSGDYQQVYAFKAVIDWLNDRATAYTNHQQTHQVKATWSNGKVATTGLSYLGTMSNALATTGVDGLEVVIAEAGISSWYDYYRENGLVTSPGGYPGEDLDSLTALTYSKNLQAGDRLRNNGYYQKALKKETEALDRTSGDYNQYWQDRNYLLHADKVTCEVVFTHGLQDWNVRPIHVWNMFHALPDTVKKHLFLHHGAHVYMNSWQSIDFRECINALLTQKLLGQDNHYQLPTVIWQDNQTDQTWKVLNDFGAKKQQTFPLGTDIQTIEQAYSQEDFDRYCKSFAVFHQDLFADKANQITIDIPLEEDVPLNGRVTLKLKVKSSIAKGFLSARLLDFGQDKRHSHMPSILGRSVLGNGRFNLRDGLFELPFANSPHRQVTQGFLNLQNRSDLLTIEEVPADQWIEFSWELQPSIYTFKKGTTLRVILYTTDFEITIRDNSDWTTSIDLAASTIILPVE